MDLAGPAGVVDTRSPPRPLFGRAPEEDGRHGRRGRGVGDAHLADDEEVGVGPRHRVPPGLQTLLEPLGAEGRFAAQVARGPTDADVDDVEPAAELAGHHRGRRRALPQGAQHLGRDRRRVGAHAFGGHAVIGDEDNGRRTVHAGPFGPLPPGQPDGHLVETGEGAAGAQDLGGARSHGGGRGIVGARERQELGVHPSTSSAGSSGTRRPATTSPARSAAAAQTPFTRPSRSR